MRSDIRLGTYGGIPVGANWSVLLVLLLVAWSLAEGVLPEEVRAQPLTAYWIAGGVAAIAFFASIALHELAHAIVARLQGLTVEGITLWLFGGVSQLSGEAPGPGAEAMIAAVGPVTSYVIGGLFLGLLAAANAVGAPDLVGAVLGWLGVINVILATFNLMPAFPLDGGRLFRALVWRLTHDQDRATATAAAVGRGFAALLMAAGLAEIIFLGAILSGLWLIVLGWFLRGAAGAEATGSTMQAALKGLTVGQVMTPNPVTLPSWTTAGALVSQLPLNYRFTTFPLTSPTGEVEGLVRLRDVFHVPPDRRDVTRLRDIARPLGSVPKATPGEPVLDLLRRIDSQPDPRVLVMDNGRLAGIVSPHDIAQAVSVLSAKRTRQAAPR